MGYITKKYTVAYGCGNCRRDFTIEIEFGTEAPDRGACPHCGIIRGVKKL